VREERGRGREGEGFGRGVGKGCQGKRGNLGGAVVFCLPFKCILGEWKSMLLIWFGRKEMNRITREANGGRGKDKEGGRRGGREGRREGRRDGR
jgi:hypothetical protein